MHGALEILEDEGTPLAHSICKGDSIKKSRLTKSVFKDGTGKPALCASFLDGVEKNVSKSNP